ncbi:MAG: response regulator [Deltaproteobacteria bacterium]|nr:response regulator [Deltaproteobacteria bacterium]
MKKEFNLLIADRNPHVRKFLRREMTAEGYQVRLAKSAREVLNRVYSSEPFDLIILDPDLSDASEVNLFERLEDRIPALPIVIHGFLIDYQESSTVNRSATFVPKQGNSSETLKKVVYELLLKSHPKSLKTHAKSQ